MYFPFFSVHGPKTDSGVLDCFFFFFSLLSSREHIHVHIDTEHVPLLYRKRARHTFQKEKQIPRVLLEKLNNCCDGSLYVCMCHVFVCVYHVSLRWDAHTHTLSSERSSNGRRRKGKRSSSFFLGQLLIDLASAVVHPLSHFFFPCLELDIYTHTHTQAQTHIWASSLYVLCMQSRFTSWHNPAPPLPITALS